MPDAPTAPAPPPPAAPVPDTPPFLPFALPDIGDEEIAAVLDCLRSGWITTGPRTRQFEHDFAAYLGGAGHAIAVNSATAGLHLALEALGIGPGDEVIVPTMTFTATAEVVRYLGAHPVLVDADPDTLNLDLAAAEAAIGPRTRAIIPVHYAGLACDMARVLALAAAHKLKVVEDAAHAFPTLYQGRLVGTLGSDATVFSFYANKTMTTGEGGMIVTRDADLARRVRLMRIHGISQDAFERYTSTTPAWFYEVVAAGFKYNLTDLAAAIGIEQLRKIDGFFGAPPATGAGLRRRAARPAAAPAGRARLRLQPCLAPVRGAPAGWRQARPRRTDPAPVRARHRHQRPFHSPAPAPVLARQLRPGAGAVPGGRGGLRDDAHLAPVHPHERRRPAARHRQPARVADMSKRLFDLAAALAGLIVLAPLLAAIAAWIRLDSPGPAWFRQQRVGRDGVLFEIIKFRTMRVGGADTAQLTVGADARITRAGQFLRRSKLDELPQLINVVFGSMSLVGPRPEVPRYVACYRPEVRAIVLSVAPGITDWASIHYKDENALLGSSADPERAYLETILPAKLAWNVRYVRERSFWTDLRIIFSTLAALVR